MACEYSGLVRDAFIAAGHEALSCDFEPTERPGPHYQGDIRDVLYQDWDLMVAHPPCTYLANSGNKHLYEKWTEAEHEAHDLIYGGKRPGHSPRPDAERWRLMHEGAEFFRLLWEADHIPRIAVENPVMHGHGIRATGGRATQFVQPWEHGHPESKATGLRLKNLPKLTPTNNVHAEMMLLPKKERQRVHYLSPGADRWKERSRTFPGIAEAMAAQWGTL